MELEKNTTVQKVLYTMLRLQEYFVNFSIVMKRNKQSKTRFVALYGIIFYMTCTYRTQFLK